jgi:hypothetical protein
MPFDNTSREVRAENDFDITGERNTNQKAKGKLQRAKGRLCLFSFLEYQKNHFFRPFPF